MTLRKTGTCNACKKPLYGDDYGAAGHDCPKKKQVSKRQMLSRFKRLQRDMGFTAEEAFEDCIEEFEDCIEELTQKREE